MPCECVHMALCACTGGMCVDLCMRHLCVCMCMHTGQGEVEGEAENWGHLLSLKIEATEAKQYFAFLGKAHLCTNKSSEAYSSLGSPGAACGGIQAWGAVLDPSLPRGPVSPGHFPIPGAAPCSAAQGAVPVADSQDGQHPVAPAVDEVSTQLLPAGSFEMDTGTPWSLVSPGSSVLERCPGLYPAQVCLWRQNTCKGVCEIRKIRFKRRK